MTYLEGVYWDLDGTIANTELEAHLPAFNYAFNDFDLNWYWDKSTYIELLKIKVMRLAIFTAGVAMIIAPTNLNPFIALGSIVCIALGAGASGALNMLIYPNSN